MANDTQMPPPGEALGQSEAFLAFGEALSAVARVERPVLILGERGTGKELAAAKLHYLSGRAYEPLVALDCAALAPSLIESELFGLEAGAFTGADRRRLGRFESADHGTLFLDEIGNIPLTAQEKILRVVEYGAFERVGGSQPVQVDVRIVGATNADLPAMAKRGKFKQDLLDRLSFEVLVIPPLRARGGDIMLLARHFAGRMAAELGWPQTPDFGPQAIEALLGHAWPGNVRQLKNVVERAVYKSNGGIVEHIEFDPFASPFAPTAAPEPEPDQDQGPMAASVVPNFKQAVAEYEKELIGRALEQARFNQVRAAELLGVSYHQLRGMLKKHGGLKAF